MTLHDFISRWFVDASWNEPENWPRRTQLAVMISTSLLVGIVLALFLIWPAWSDLQRVRTERSEVSAQVLNQSNLLRDAPMRSRELQALRAGRIDPTSVDAAERGFAATTPMVVVTDSDGTVTLDGEGTFAQLEQWVRAIVEAKSIPLLRWKSLRIESREEALTWVGELMRVEKQSENAGTTGDSHAVSIGRNPFVSSQEPAVTTSSDALAATSRPLPNEDAWPRPRVTDWPFENLRMVGTLGANLSRVLLMAGSKSVYVVRVGDVIGRERRVVREIRAHRISAGNGVVTLTPQIIERAP